MHGHGWDTDRARGSRRAVRCVPVPMQVLRSCRATSALAWEHCRRRYSHPWALQPPCTVRPAAAGLRWVPAVAHGCSISAVAAPACQALHSAFTSICAGRWRRLAPTAARAKARGTAVRHIGLLHRGHHGEGLDCCVRDGPSQFSLYTCRKHPTWHAAPYLRTFMTFMIGMQVGMGMYAVRVRPKQRPVSTLLP